jgi:hypothetical protein
MCIAIDITIRSPLRTATLKFFNVNAKEKPTEARRLISQVAPRVVGTFFLTMMVSK